MESLITLITNSTFCAGSGGFHTLKLTPKEHKALKNLVVLAMEGGDYAEEDYLFCVNEELKEHNEFIQAENEKLREENEGLKSLKQSEINEAVISDEGTAKLILDIAKLIGVVNEREEEIESLKKAVAADTIDYSIGGINDSDTIAGVIDVIQDYIIHSEMGGDVDEEDSWMPLLNAVIAIKTSLNHNENYSAHNGRDDQACDILLEYLQRHSELIPTDDPSSGDLLELIAELGGKMEQDYEYQKGDWRGIRD